MTSRPQRSHTVATSTPRSGRRGSIIINRDSITNHGAARKPQFARAASIPIRHAVPANPTFSLPQFRVNEHELRRQAHEELAQLNFQDLTDRTRCDWQWRHTKNEFDIFLREKISTSQNNGRQRSFELLVTGVIDCSAEEVLRLLHGSTSNAHTATMQRLYQDKFISGSIVHEVPVAASISGKTEEIAVKTVCFARNSVFGKNEQWCYLEQLQTNARKKNGFKLTMSTMDMRELSAIKIPAIHDRVEQLHGMTLACVVKPVPGTPKSLQFWFHCRFNGRKRKTGSSHSGISTYASAKTIKARLTAIAKAITLLPELISRNRFGRQILADHNAFEANNTRCTCCTKSLSFLNKKKRCCLCGNNVCDKCWTVQQTENASYNSNSSINSNGNDGELIRSIIVCRRCVTSVNNCDYSRPRDETGLESHKPQVKPDPENSAANQHSGKELVDYLQQVMHSSSTSKRAAAMSVMRQLLDQDPANHGLSRRRGTSNASFLTSSKISGEGSKAINEYVLAVEKYLAHDDEFLLEDCVLASSETRKYPLHMSESPATVSADSPEPANEEARLTAVRESRVLDLENVDELNILCELAAKELDCPMSALTIVDKDEQTILATNVPSFENSKGPRNQSFCQHLVMDDKPLLVPDAEADVRFHNIGFVTDHNVKFYCGFPIQAADGSVLGGMCCLDTQPRELTRTQYAAMQKIAKSASQIIQKKGQDLTRNVAYQLI